MAVGELELIDNKLNFVRVKQIKTRENFFFHVNQNSLELKEINFRHEIEQAYRMI